jgi:hypothetical protein
MNFYDNISMNELQYLGDLFWKKNKLQKKDFELIYEDYNKILWLYKDTYISLFLVVFYFTGQICVVYL